MRQTDRIKAGTHNPYVGLYGAYLEKHCVQCFFALKARAYTTGTI